MTLAEHLDLSESSRQVDDDAVRNHSLSTSKQLALRFPDVDFMCVQFDLRMYSSCNTVLLFYFVVFLLCFSRPQFRLRLC